MDLIDLIGDSRTDSLPPGFLRSIKIKYKQEASHVFPKGEKPTSAEGATERAESAISAKSTPSFMGWRVPTRLVTRPQAPVPKTPASVFSYQDERQKLSSRLSGMSLGSAASLHKPVNKADHLPRLNSVASSRKSVMEKHKPTLPKLTTEEDVLEGLDKEDTMSPQGRKVIKKILSEADKGAGKFTSLSQKAISSNVMDAVDKWLVTATDKEREVALKFFSTLAGSKAEFLKNPSQKYHTHIDGNCHFCDGKRIDETLDTLARGDGIVMRGKHAYNPKREPNLGHHSYYQLAKNRLPTRVRREYQTWHHLPVYNYHDGVPNKSSMFTQPHKPLGRHFSIHPEWGLHTGIKHGAF